MNIIETKKLEKIDSIGRWSQERIMNMCIHIIMASNEIQEYEKVCGDEVDVGPDLLTVLQTAGSMYAPVPKIDLGQFPYEGVLNGVIKVHLNYDLEPNAAVIYHGDTGIKLIFVGMVLTSAFPFFSPQHDADNPNFLGLLNVLVKVYSDGRIPDNAGIIGLEVGDTTNYRHLVFNNIKLEAI